MSTEPNRRNRRPIVAGTILIALGLYFFVGQFLNLEGPLFFVGLGAVFLAAYALGRRLLGFLIAGNILVAIGLFSAIDELDVLPSTLSGALFFLMPGSAFIGVYVMRNRAAYPQSRRGWALITGLALWAFAAFIFLVENAVLFSSAAWASILRFWPVILILLGLWLLLRRLQEVRG